MSSPSLRIPPFLSYLFRRGRHDRADHSVADELALDPAGVAELAPGLELTWLGTSGFRLTYEGESILIDPYVTRVPLKQLLRRRPLHSDPELVTRHLSGARAILVGHTHFDHALDVPAAAETGARAYGSTSVRNLLDLFGRGEQAVVVEPYRTYEEGPFEITFVPSVHSRLVLGLKVPAAGEICCEHFDDLTPGAFRCGEVYGIHISVGGTQLYHQGSADLIDDAVRHRGVDIFLAGIAGRGFTDQYLERILSRLEPNLVIPHHYDDFFVPLADDMRFSFNVDLAGFPDEVGQVSRDFRVATLHPLTTYVGGTR